MADIKEILSTKQAKTVLVILAIAILGYILFSVGVSIYSIYETPKPILKIFIIGAKDFFQILFYIVVATVGVFTYIRAKETLFTPIKTETFKMQIKAFEVILAFFQTKTETDFSHQFDFDFIVGANARFMIADYIATFFKNEIKINDEAMKELRDKFSGAIVLQSFMEKNFESLEYYEKKNSELKQEITNPALILENWKSYEYGHIMFTKKFADEMDKLMQLIASPLLPNELKMKLEFFKSRVRENLSLVGTVLTTLAQELPQKFPNAKSIDNLEMSGIWNRYNHESKDLEPTAKDILSYIREYLKIDTLVD